MNDHAPAEFTLDTGTDWQDGAATVQLLEDASDGIGIYIEAGSTVTGALGAVATPEQAEALGRALIELAAEARRRPQHH